MPWALLQIGRNSSGNTDGKNVHSWFCRQCLSLLVTRGGNEKHTQCVRGRCASPLGFTEPLGTSSHGLTKTTSPPAWSAAWTAPCVPTACAQPQAWPAHFCCPQRLRSCQGRRRLSHCMCMAGRPCMVPFIKRDVGVSFGLSCSLLI